MTDEHGAGWSDQPALVARGDQNWSEGQAVLDQLVTLLAGHRQHCDRGAPCCGAPFLRALTHVIATDDLAPAMMLWAAVWRLSSNPDEVDASALRVFRRGPGVPS